MCQFHCVFPGCNATWDVAEAPSVGCSHGLCPKHARPELLESFRRQQRKEGVPDCAGRCFGNCATIWCTYYPVCVNENPTWADYRKIEDRQMVRRTALYGKPCGVSHAVLMASLATA